jgi:hypothetical protein
LANSMQRRMVGSSSSAVAVEQLSPITFNVPPPEPQARVSRYRYLPQREKTAVLPTSSLTSSTPAHRPPPCHAGPDPRHIRSRRGRRTACARRAGRRTIGYDNPGKAGTGTAGRIGSQSQAARPVRA